MHPRTFNYNEDEVKALAKKLNITESQARYKIYQKAYQKRYREENKARLSIYHKKWELTHVDVVKGYYRTRVLAELERSKENG